MAVISKEQWKERLDAALALRGVDKTKLHLELAPVVEAHPRRFERYPVSNPAKASRMGDETLPTERMIAIVALALRVPEDWFLADDFDAWLARPSAGAPVAQTILADSDLAEALAELGEAQQQLQRVQGRLMRGEPPEEGRGSG